MFKSTLSYTLSATLGLYLLGNAPLVFAAETQTDEFAPKHKVVIQVSTDDPRIHQLVINNAANLQKSLGMDNVAIEVVAYGPGLKLFTTPGPENQLIPSLAQQNISFSACGNTLNNMTEQMGHPPTLAQGVKVVPAGVVRIMELQEQGYAYIRP